MTRRLIPTLAIVTVLGLTCISCDPGSGEGGKPQPEQPTGPTTNTVPPGAGATPPAGPPPAAPPGSKEKSQDERPGAGPSR